MNYNYKKYRSLLATGLLICTMLPALAATDIYVQLQNNNSQAVKFGYKDSTCMNNKLLEAALFLAIPASTQTNFMLEGNTCGGGSFSGSVTICFASAAAAKGVMGLPSNDACSSAIATCQASVTNNTTSISDCHGATASAVHGDAHTWNITLSGASN